MHTKRTSVPCLYGRFVKPPASDCSTIRRQTIEGSPVRLLQRCLAGGCLALRWILRLLPCLEEACAHSLRPMQTKHLYNAKPLTALRRDQVTSRQCLRAAHKPHSSHSPLQWSPSSCCCCYCVFATLDFKGIPSFSFRSSSAETCSMGLHNRCIWSSICARF